MNWPSTAITHEWLVSYAGSERCVESFTNIWKDADVFALVDFLNDEQRKIILKGKKAHTTFIQHLPFAKKKHRYYLPLFPKAIESLDLSKYKLIISSSHAVSKGVKKSDDQLLICYCHSPMRYAWDQSEHYLTGIKGSFAKAFMNYLRKWDLKSAKNVNYFIANSHHIAEKIKRIYNRDSNVIYPPVDVFNFDVSTNKDDYYLIASRFVPYKKVDVVVEAFNKMPDKKLLVIGSGPDKEKVKAIANSNIDFLPHQEFPQLKEYMKKAKAFVFAAEEDFGIVIVEAMACGTPVIALNKGGTAESVINGETGIHFNDQTPDSIITAVKEFEKRIDYFDVQIIRKHAEQFNRSRFEEKIKNFVNDKLSNYRK
jgi:glycosyltransferase involved in cell wall biosynthesis